MGNNWGCKAGQGRQPGVGNQIVVETTKGAVTNEGKDAHPGGSKGGRRIRLQMGLQNTRSATTYFLHMGVTRCQISVAGTTYIPKVERESHVSDRDCDYKTRAGTTHLL